MEVMDFFGLLELFDERMRKREDAIKNIRNKNKKDVDS